MKAYEEPILGISYDALWGDTLYIPPLPPNFGTRPKKGRRVTKRRMGAKEVNEKTGRMKRQQRTLHCRKCGVEGHNTTTCKSNEVGGQIGVAAGSQSGVASRKQVSTNRAIRKKVSTKKGNNSGNSVQRNNVEPTKKTNVEANTEIELAPPRVPLVTPNADEGGNSDVAT
ncbi:hypothetical protein ACS0TY_025011 [Phlomoides rotata]